MYQSTTIKIKKSLVSMAIGKPISALSGLLVLIFLSRYLNPAEYGAYFTLWAMAEIIILSSNLGLLNACYRYVSAEVTSEGRVIAQGPIVWFILVRLTSIIVFSSIIIGNDALLGIFTDNGSLYQNNKIIILFIVVFEGVARFIEIIFDSMLCQTRSQITLIARTLLRLAGILFVSYTSQLTIKSVFMVEAVATGFGALLSIFLIVKIAISSTNITSFDESKLTVSRVVKFALPSYLAQLLGLLYGPDILKLILNQSAGPEVLALFGFSFSIAAIVQRYMPANLLAGIFRPAFVAASKKESSIEMLSMLMSICIKINFIFIIPIILVCYSSADFILSIMSAGNYDNAGMVLTVILGGLLIVSIHLVLSMYCLALEKAVPSFIAALAGSLCLPVAIYFSKNYGATGIAFVFGLSELLWVVTCLSIVGKNISSRDFHWVGLLKLILFLISNMVMANIALNNSVNPVFILIVNLSFFLLSMFVINFFSRKEVDFLVSVFPILNKIKGLK